MRSTMCAIDWLTAVRRSHTILQIDGTLHGVDGTAELHQDAIAGSLENSTLVFGDKRVQVPYCDGRFNAASVPASSASIIRLKPTTSAARMAARRR